MGLLDRARFQPQEEKMEGSIAVAPDAEDAAVVARLASTAAGDFEVLRLEDLHVDHTYQRELSADLVDKIAREWDMATAGAILVARRPNGDLHVVDGQHRSAAAKQRGETEILAQVIEGLTAEEEAKLRLQGNVRRTDKPYERFRAQIRAGNPESIAIQAICEQFETRINPFPDAKKGINSVSAVEAIYRKDKGMLLTRTLELVQDCFGAVGGQSATVPILKSFAFLIERHGADMERPRLVERLKSTGVDQLQRLAVNYRAVHRGAMWTNYYRAEIEVYNDRLTPSKQLEWRLSGWSTSGLGKDYGDSAQG